MTSIEQLLTASYDFVFNVCDKERKYNFFTVDSDGSGILWTNKPMLQELTWTWGPEDGNARYVGQFDPEDWKDSLIERKRKNKQKAKKGVPCLTKQEAAGISKNVAIGTLLNHIRKGVYEAASRGLRTWRIPTSCFVPRMLDEEDFNQIIVRSGYDFSKLDDGDVELRWR